MPGAGGSWSHRRLDSLPNLTRFLDRIDDTQLLVLEGMGHFGPRLYPDLLISLATGAAG